MTTLKFSGLKSQLPAIRMISASKIKAFDMQILTSKMKTKDIKFQEFSWSWNFTEDQDYRISLFWSK